MQNLIFRYSLLADLFWGSVLTAKHQAVKKPILKIDRKGLEEEITLEELAKKSFEFANYLLRQKGIKAGDRVALLGKNRVNWDVSFWGIVLAGAIPVLIDPERKPKEVRQHLNHTKSKILIMADDYQGKQEQTADPLPNGHRLIKPTDTAVILCTSGTTGDPREVELAHRNLLYNLQGALEKVKIGRNDILGHILPPHHSFGLTVGKLLPLSVGATNVYTDKYHRLPEFIKNEGITIFAGVPRLFTALARKIEDGLSEKKKTSRLTRLLDQYFPKIMGKFIIHKLGWQRLRFMVSGSAAVPKWVLPALWRLRIELREGYGLTENSPVYGLNDNPKKLGSVGRPISTILVKIVKDEVFLGGPCIAKGYYRNPQATQQNFETDVNGVRWLHTGDMGYLDEDGYLYITGRKKYIIVLSGGKKVHPEKVETVLSQTPYVKEILVAPAFDEFGQEALGAIVVPDFDIFRGQTDYPTLLNCIWQSISECQKESPDLAPFERITSKKNIRLQHEPFEKTSNGKIKREPYLIQPKPVVP